MYYKKLFSFDEIYTANISQTNLAEKIDASDREAIATLVCERKEQDKKTMEDWLTTVEKGLELMDSKYKPKCPPWPDAYNAQVPLLLNATSSTASRLFTEVHRDTYLPNPKILGRDDDNTKAMRLNRVKKYINAVAIDYPYSSWLENQSKMYNRLVLMGTQIKQVKFHQETVTFSNGFVPYNDIFIHNKSESLEKAPAITKRFYLPQNEIIERMNAGVYAKYDFKVEVDAEGDVSFPGFPGQTTNNYQDTTDDDDTPMYARTYALLEQHVGFDLDGDGYEEPYIAIVEENSGTLYRLVPRIDLSTSQFIHEDEKVKPLILRGDCYFADFHFMPDPSGNFWSIGLANMIGGINTTVNEMMSNMINVATMATRQGGLFAAGAKNAAGRIKVDGTKYTAVPGVSGDKLRDAMIPFDIRDPSPVLKDITFSLIEMGEKIGTLSEALSGEMPAREMPAQTMLMLVEQSLKNAQAVYRRVHMGLTKELQIMCRLLVQNGNQENYQEVLDDPNADLARDLDLTSMDLSYTTDSSTGSSAENIIKFNIIMESLQNDAVAPFINVKELFTRLCLALDIPDPDKLITDPPPPEPPVEEKLGQRQLDIQEDKNQNEFLIKVFEAIGSVTNARATAAKNLAEANIPAEQALHKQVQFEAPAPNPMASGPEAPEGNQPIPPSIPPESAQ